MNFRLGLIGVGRWGRNVVRTAEQTPGVTLTRVASRNPATVELVPPSCLISDDWHEVVAADDLDGVMLATPPAVQVEIATEAVCHGLPVLAEKPLSLSVERAEALERVVETHGGLVMVDHIHLFNPVYERLKVIGASLGPVRAIHARAGSGGPFRADLSVLWDWGPHDIAMCLDLLGDTPQTMSARIEETRSTPDGRGETIAINLVYPGEVLAEIEISNLYRQRTRRFEVTFDDARLTLQDYADPALTRDGVAVETDGTPPLQRSIEVFATSVTAGRADRSDISFGVEVVRVLDRLQRRI